jgi:hypothetical protein
MKANKQREIDEMRPEYEFDYSRAVRGKYYRRLIKEGANVVALESDVAKEFRSSAEVNDALRSLLKVTEITRSLRQRSTLRSKRPAATRAVGSRGK